jgi:hypothetical protein
LKRKGRLDECFRLHKDVEIYFGGLGDGRVKAGWRFMVSGFAMEEMDLWVDAGEGSRD